MQEKNDNLHLVVNEISNLIVRVFLLNKYHNHFLLFPKVDQFVYQILIFQLFLLDLFALLFNHMLVILTIQLILFCIIQNVNDASHFGNSEKLFEAINEEEFKKKIEESMADIGDFFKDTDKMFNENSDLSGNDFNMPDSEKIHEHINTNVNVMYM